MRAKDMTHAEKKMYKVLKLFWLNYSNSILPFFYDYFPDAEEINNLIIADRRRRSNKVYEDIGRVQGGDKIPQAQKIMENADEVYQVIRQSGGLDIIRTVVRRMAKDAPVEWLILAKWGEIGGYRYPTVQSLANIDEINLLRSNVYRKANEWLKQTAKEILRHKNCVGCEMKGR